MNYSALAIISAILAVADGDSWFSLAWSIIWATVFFYSVRRAI